MSNTVAILVCYYPAYKLKAAGTLRDMISKIDKQSYLCIVNNNNECKNIKAADCQAEITGSNASWEFSAWDEGVTYLKSQGLIKDDTLLILANDTFCFNRKFNWFNRWVFRRGFNHIKGKANLLAGEFCSAAESYNIYGHDVNGWISTYLFACQGAALSSCLPFSKSQEMRNHVDYFIDQDKRTLSLSNSSDSISKHLEHWFFPKAQGAGWYKAKDGSAGVELIEKKLLAVINEKLLSAVCEAAGVKLYDVYSNRLFRKIVRQQKQKWSKRS